MCNVLKRWFLWFLFGTAFCAIGCDSSDTPPADATAIDSGVAGQDAFALDAQSETETQLNVIDALSILDVGTTLNNGNVDVRSHALDAGTTTTPVVLDATSDATPDTEPALVCEDIGPIRYSVGVTFSIALYCVTLRPALVAPIKPLDYVWTCDTFTDADRIVTVNGQRVSCVGQSRDGNSIGSILPALVNGAWTFMFYANDHTSGVNRDAFTWRCTRDGGCG